MESSDTVIVYPVRDPLFGYSSAGLEEALKKALSGQVEQAYFFGSFAVGNLTHHSDIDILLVQKTAEPFLSRGKCFLNLYDIVPSLDLLVYTPEEFQTLITDPSPGFWTSVKSTLRRFL